jgi:hypothetical protein
VPNHHQSIRLAISKLPQDHVVHDGEDGGIGAHPQGDGEESEERVSRASPGSPEGVAHVLPEASMAEKLAALPLLVELQK